MICQMLWWRKPSVSLWMTFVPSCLHIPYLGVLICRCEQNVRLQFNSQCSLECWADKISDSSSQIILLPHNCSPSSLLARTPRENLFSTIGISSKVKEFFWGTEIGDGPIRGPSEGSQSERLTVNGEIPGLPVITWNYFAGTGSVTSPKSAEHPDFYVQGTISITRKYVLRWKSEATCFFSSSIASGWTWDVWWNQATISTLTAP